MDSIDLDPEPILGIGSDIYRILNRFRMHLGESMKSQKLPDNFLPSPLGIGEPHGHANQAHQS
jgi:hypothetical protein